MIGRKIDDNVTLFVAHKLDDQNVRFQMDVIDPVGFCAKVAVIGNNVYIIVAQNHFLYINATNDSLAFLIRAFLILNLTRERLGPCDVHDLIWYVATTIYNQIWTKPITVEDQKEKCVEIFFDTYKLSSVMDVKVSKLLGAKIRTEMDELKLQLFRLKNEHQQYMSGVKSMLAGIKIPAVAKPTMCNAITQTVEPVVMMKKYAQIATEKVAGGTQTMITVPHRLLLDSPSHFMNIVSPKKSCGGVSVATQAIDETRAKIEQELQQLRALTIVSPKKSCGGVSVATQAIDETHAKIEQELQQLRALTRDNKKEREKMRKECKKIVRLEYEEKFVEQENRHRDQLTVLQTRIDSHKCDLQTYLTNKPITAQSVYDFMKNIEHVSASTAVAGYCILYTFKQAQQYLTECVDFEIPHQLLKFYDFFNNYILPKIDESKQRPEVLNKLYTEWIGFRQTFERCNIEFSADVVDKIFWIMCLGLEKQYDNWIVFLPPFFQFVCNHCINVKKLYGAMINYTELIKKDGALSPENEKILVHEFIGVFIGRHAFSVLSSICHEKPEIAKRSDCKLIY